MELLGHSQGLEAYLPLPMELAEIAMCETGLTRAAIQPPRPVTWREVADISRNDLIRFESHGVSHAAMSTFTEEEIIFEMKHSRDVVTEHTGRPCRHLAYPFGSRQSIGARSAAKGKRFSNSAIHDAMARV